MCIARVAVASKIVWYGIFFLLKSQNKLVCFRTNRNLLFNLIKNLILFVVAFRFCSHCIFCLFVFGFILFFLVFILFRLVFFTFLIWVAHTPQINFNFSSLKRYLLWNIYFVSQKKKNKYENKIYVIFLPMWKWIK